MWECLKCGELVDGDFEVCWSCGTSQNGEEDPEFRTADEYTPEEQSLQAEVEQHLAQREAELSPVVPGFEPPARPPAGEFPARPPARQPLSGSRLFCSRCGSHQIIPSTRLEVYVRTSGMDGGPGRGVVNARVDTDPEAWFFKGATRSELSARVCGSCGHAEIYADNPEILWQAYQEQQQRPDGRSAAPQSPLSFNQEMKTTDEL